MYCATSESYFVEGKLLYTMLIMKHHVLYGSQIADFVKKARKRRCGVLKQDRGIHPKLIILRSHDDPVSTIYLRAKSVYGDDIGCSVAIETLSEQLCCSE